MILPREMTVALVQHNLLFNLTLNNIKLKSLNSISLVIPKGTLMSSMVNINTDINRLKDESVYLSMDNLKSHLLLKPLENLKPIAFLQKIIMFTPLSIYIPQIKIYVKELYMYKSILKVEIELFIEESCEFLLESWEYFTTENRFFAPKFLFLLKNFNLLIQDNFQYSKKLLIFTKNYILNSYKVLHIEVSSWITLYRSSFFKFSSSVQEYIATNQAIQNLILSGVYLCMFIYMYVHEHKYIYIYVYI
jgi:hypothetical protein